MRSNHPNEDLIESYVMGCLPATELADIEKHLLLRADCRISVEETANYVEAMRRALQSAWERTKALSVFDVFLCHNTNSKSAVKRIGRRLMQRGIAPWLDEWQLRPGVSWHRSLENEIENIKSAAVFIDDSGIGPWQDQELQAFLREFVRRTCPVIPVILPGTRGVPSLPVFLRGNVWVDFRKRSPNPLDQLIWGITGEIQQDYV
jgi:hypothetical protein